MRDGVRIATIRPAGDALGFVLNSWLQSYAARGQRVHGLNRPLYYRTHHPELLRLVERNAVALATLEDDADCFLGWACGAPGVLHYVYVKHAFRECGIAHDLVAAVAGEPKVYTFEPGTKEGDARPSLVAVAERKGWKYHAHPVPGVLVHKQLKAQRA